MFILLFEFRFKLKRPNMKKLTIFTVLCAFVFINSINAQDMKFGVKGSFLTSTISTGNNVWSKLRPGFDVGGYFQYNIMEILGVSIEPVYAVKGANDINPLYFYDQYSPKFDDAAKQHNLALSVIEVPILAQLNLDMGGIAMRVFGGPSFDFILGANHITYREEASAGDDFINDIKSEADVTERFVYNNYTAVIGVGFDIEMDPVDLRIDLKYQHGFTNINNVELKPAIYTHSFGISVGIGLDKLILK